MVEKDQEVMGENKGGDSVGKEARVSKKRDTAEVEVAPKHINIERRKKLKNLLIKKRRQIRKAKKGTKRN